MKIQKTIDVSEYTDHQIEQAIQFLQTGKGEIKKETVYRDILIKLVKYLKTYNSSHDLYSRPESVSQGILSALKSAAREQNIDPEELGL